MQPFRIGEDMLPHAPYPHSPLTPSCVPCATSFCWQFRVLFLLFCLFFLRLFTHAKELPSVVGCGIAGGLPGGGCKSRITCWFLPVCASQMGATKRRRRHRHRRLDSFIYLQTKETNWLLLLLLLMLLLLLCGSDEASDMCVTKGCAVDNNNNKNSNNMGQNNSNSRHGSGFDLMPRCRRR